MSERRWTDADLRAAWEDGVRQALYDAGYRNLRTDPGAADPAWQKSKTRGRIRALEIARAGLPKGQG